MFGETFGLGRIISIVTEPVALLSQEERDFLEQEKISISGAYIGMLRAYRRDAEGNCLTIWQTSSSAPIEAAIQINQTMFKDHRSIQEKCLVDDESLLEQLRYFIRVLQSMPEELREELVYSRHVSLFEPGYLEDLAKRFL